MMSDVPRLKKKRQVQFRRGLEAQIAEKREAVRRRVEEERLAEQEASLKEAQVSTGREHYFSVD